MLFRPGKKSRLKLIEDAVTIILRDDDVVELANSLQPRAGVYPVPGVKNVVLQVLKTEVEDRHGKVVDVVG